MNPSQQPEPVSPWPHRCALLLAGATFPLLWVGGLVTTHKAGMAVPDWPSTYGYNLLLYPWSTWWGGPWDLFIEHGHRLLGVVVGMLAIALLVAALRCEPRGWMKAAAALALALVIFQGLLGGARVLFDQRQVAQLHGCVGPAFFAVAACLAVATSRRWREAQRWAPADDRPDLRRLAYFTLFFAYTQIVLGSNLRHIEPMAPPGQFRAFVMFHIAVALIVVAQSWLLAGGLWRARTAEPWLRRPATLLALLTLGQLALGGAAWVVKYGPPTWLQQSHWAAGFTITAEGMLQSLVVTGHVALGALILATAAVTALRLARLAPIGASSGSHSSNLWSVAA